MMFVKIATFTLCITAALVCQAGESIAWRQTFDDDGRIASVIDPSGRATQYRYETNSGGDLRKLSVIPPVGPKVSYSFDGKQRLAGMTDEEGRVVYKYDKHGQLHSVEREGSPTIEYTYDLTGRPATMKIDNFYHLSWKYDYLGRLQSMDTPAGSVTYEYQTGRNEVIRTLPNGIKTFWKRQANGQLDKITHGYFENPDSTSYSVLARYTYQHDPSGRISAIREKSSQGEIVRSYSYDTMGRLIRAEDTSGQQYNYKYDLVGNRTQATASRKPDQNYSYDWAGRLTSYNGKPVAYDASGNLSKIELDGSIRQYRYYPDNRLAEAKVGDERVLYSYDGHGRLIDRKTAWGETHFIPDPLSPNWQPLVLEESSGTRTLVIWDGAVPLATISDGKTEWFLHDHLGSVRLVTDHKGNAEQFVEYEPFGSLEDNQFNRPLSPGYAGLFHDAGLRLTLARSYLNKIGAFLQPDPRMCLPTENTVNCALYIYCENDPVNYIDLNGAERVPAETQMDLSNKNTEMKRDLDDSLSKMRRHYSEIQRDINNRISVIIRSQAQSQREMERRLSEMRRRQSDMQSDVLRQHEEMVQRLRQQSSGVGERQLMGAEQFRDDFLYIWPRALVIEGLNVYGNSASSFGFSLVGDILKYFRNNMITDLGRVDLSIEERFNKNALTADRITGIVGGIKSIKKIIKSVAYRINYLIELRGYDSQTRQQLFISINPERQSDYGLIRDRLPSNRIVEVIPRASWDFSRTPKVLWEEYGIRILKESQLNYNNKHLNESTLPSSITLDFLHSPQSVTFDYYTDSGLRIAGTSSSSTQYTYSKDGYSKTIRKTAQYNESRDGAALSKAVERYNKTGIWEYPGKSSNKNPEESNSKQSKKTPKEKKREKKRRKDEDQAADSGSSCTGDECGSGGDRADGGNDGCKGDECGDSGPFRGLPGGGCKGDECGGGGPPHGSWRFTTADSNSRRFQKLEDLSAVTMRHTDYASQASPSTVGGVYLSGAGGILEGLSDLRGILLDANGKLVLVGINDKHIKLPPLGLDDVVTIFRSVYIYGEGPSVSIDPNPKNPENSAMIIRHGKATEDTYVGWVLYEADRLMKSYTQGLDNKTQQKVKSSVPGYSDVLETIYFGGADPSQSQKNGVWERFWIVPADVNRFEGRRKELTLFDVPLKVKTQKMRWAKGKLVDDLSGESSPGAMAFTKWFTNKYDNIADEQYLLPPPESGLTEAVPVFTELQRVALITAIAEKLRDDGVPMPFWMREYEVRKVPFEKFTPGLKVTRTKTEDDMVRTAHVFGGVQLTPDSMVVKTFSALDDVQKSSRKIRGKASHEFKLATELEQVLTEAVSTEPMPIATPWTIKAGGDTYTVTAVPGAETRALGPCQLDEVDISVPVSGYGRIQLIRSFNSFFNPKGPWGKGWALNLPHLGKVVVPISGEDGKVATTTGYEILTPLNSYYARFLYGKPVSKFTDSNNVFIDNDSPFDGMYQGKQPFFKNLETRLIRLKDGQKWYFSQYGDLVAAEDGALATVYERDKNGQITRIAALLGGTLAAEIKMDYTNTGLLKKAIGRDLLNKDSLPIEVIYSYNAENHLKGLEEVVYSYNEDDQVSRMKTRGPWVGYEYSGPWVSEINWRDTAMDDSKSITVSSFKYNQHGQLISENFGYSQRQYSTAITQDGWEAHVRIAGTGSSNVRTRYDSQMRPLETVAANGTTTKWTYGTDGSSKLTTSTPDGVEISTVDSANGRQRSIRLDGGPEIQAHYDDGGRLIELAEENQPLFSLQWRPDGQSASFSTNSQTLQLSYGDNAMLDSILLHPPTAGTKLSEWQETNVDSLGRPVAVKDNTGLNLQIHYDKEGDISTLFQETGEGNVGFDIERDDDGRMKRIDSSWGTADYTYSNSGALVEVKSRRNGQEASIDLVDGRIKQVTDYDGGITLYEYHKDNILSGFLNYTILPNTLKLQNAYNIEGGLEAVTVGSIRRLKLEYDSENRITGYVWQSL